MQRMRWLVQVVGAVSLAFLLVTPSLTAFASASVEPTVRVVVGWAGRDASNLALRRVPAGAQVVRRLSQLRATVYEVPQGRVDAWMAEMKARPDVRYVEPDGTVWGLELVPNDPEFRARQYGPQHLNAPQAWEITMGDPRVIIAIVDTGVDLSHPEFAGRLVSGYDFVNDDPVPQDDHGHGTHVAGIAAAGTNNGIGVAGMCGQCRVMPVKVLDQNNRGYWSSVAAGIVFAADHGARVINLSLGGTGGSQAVQDAIRYATEKGALVVAAAGNGGSNQSFYPAAYDNVLAVAALNPDDTWWDLSNYGDYVDIAAPGVTVYSTLWTVEGPSYGFKSGTSMAAPHIAGVAGLLFSQDPNLGPEEVEAIIASTAVDLGDPGWDPYYGHGLADAHAALRAITKTQPPPAGALQVVTFYDLDGDGAQDPEEQNPVVGVGITVQDAASQVVASGETDSNGLFLAQDLPVGVYTVNAEEPAGLIATAVSSATVSVEEGRTSTVGFGYLAPTRLSLLSLEVGLTPEGKVLLTWVVTDSVQPAFAVYRAEASEGPYIRLSGTPEQVTAPVGTAGEAYRYLDETVMPGHTYWYQVAEENQGQFFGPVQVSVPVAEGPPARVFVPLTVRNW